MKKYWHTLAVLTLFFNATCQTPGEIKESYPRMIGDIAYNPSIDTTNFELCWDEKFAVQYYAFTSTFNQSTYLKEKYAVHKIFEANYNADRVPLESGLVSVRFLVNCRGESGRFRVKGMDENYQEKVFTSAITQQLVNITKNELEWKAFKTDKAERDYYQYLIFKIENGQIIDILP